MSSDSAAGAALGGARSDRRSFFEYYKKGQGTWTRGGTALGGGVLTATGCHFIFQQLEATLDAAKAWSLYVQVGVPGVVFAVLGVILWWVVGINRKSCDFMIATEGEMKKVSWSTRRELIGSTKVVILFTILMAAILFFVDIVFMRFFGWIGVLRLGT